MSIQALKYITGSYHQNDCRFLLQPIELTPLSVAEKEQQLQSGKKHYSEMISTESEPSAQYLEIFRYLVNQYKQRLAEEITVLARCLHQIKGKDNTIVSLARAGTPIGVLLARALKYYYNSNVNHYSISIIRDRGIDQVALTYLKNQGYAADSIIFVDGWTAKGVITQELKTSIQDWNLQNPDYIISDELCVVSDIGGSADIVATDDDYAIPSGVLNSTVSGLVSRTINLQEHKGFHQCITYDHLKEHDLSNWFIDQVTSLFDQSLLTKHTDWCSNQSYQLQRKRIVSDFIDQVMLDYQVDDINKIKPGISEATRVMLRRIPRILILKDINSPNVKHLIVLSKEKTLKSLKISICHLML